MTRLYFDNSNLNVINSELNNAAKEIVATTNIANSIAIPYGFERSHDIQTCNLALSQSKNLIDETKDWLLKNDVNFANKKVEQESRIQKIVNIEIRKKDLLIK